MSQEFLDHLKKCGIVSQFTPSYTSQHNGVSEKRNRTLLDMVRSMMNQTTLPMSIWDYALEFAARILNMVLTKKVEKTPYELWHGKVPCADLVATTAAKDDMRKAYDECSDISQEKPALIDTFLKQESDKDYEMHIMLCLEMRIPKETMGYYFYYPREHKIIVARYAEFFESSLISQDASGSLYINVEEHELGDHGEPANYKAALSDTESDKWLKAINAEMQSMKDNEVWVEVDLQPNAKTVESNWLFKKKTDMDDNVHTYKAHLVAKCYTQTYDIDYEETFSHVAKIKVIRILFAIAAFYDYEIWQMDVKTALLIGHLTGEIYMVQPEGIANPKHLK
ncbi:retrotransposon protein, putative, ty1-copia subclass [Tanacetum coccineum]